MEESPSWEANNHSSSQNFHVLWNPKVHYHICKSPPLVPILSHMNPVHTFPPYFPKIHSNIILISTSRSYKWSLAFRILNQNIVCISQLSHPCYIPCSCHLLALITLIVFHQACKLQSSSLCSLLQLPTSSYLLDPNVLLSTLFLNILNLIFFS
jgi:hypothetical protein